MIILGLILAILGLLLSVPVLWIIGLVLLAVGVILWIAGAVGEWCRRKTALLLTCSRNRDARTGNEGAPGLHRTWGFVVCGIYLAAIGGLIGFVSGFLPSGWAARRTVEQDTAVIDERAYDR